MSDTHWTTQDGRTLRIRDMDDSHLLNAIRFIRRRAEDEAAHVFGGLNHGFDVGFVAYGEAFPDELKAMLIEARRRNLPIEAAEGGADA